MRQSSFKELTPCIWNSTAHNAEWALFMRICKMVQQSPFLTAPPTFVPSVSFAFLNFSIMDDFTVAIGLMVS